MLPVDAYRRLDATALAELLRRGELRPLDLLESALTAVAALDPPLGAVVMLHAEEAAAQIAAGLPAGPLAGLPFLLKDLGVAWRGTPTTHGLPARYDRRAEADCPTVARCRAAGLVLFGKTHSAPLGMSVETVSRRFGATRNPWDLTRSAGGSSGGAAAAVAAGVVPVAQASDGGGSLRLPAACCGLVGLMPTAARAPLGRARGGVGPAPVRHVLARTVRDVALFTEALARAGSTRSMDRLAARPPGPLRVALSTRAPLGLPVDPALAAGVEEAARRAAAAGHRVEPADPPLGDARLLADLGLCQDAAAATALAARARAAGIAERPGELEPALEARVARAWVQPPGALAAASARLRAFRPEMARFFGRYDLLVQPATATPTPPLGALSLEATDLDTHLLESLAFAPFTWLANAAGLPSMSLPLPGEGLPRGLLVTGPWGSEAELLRFAAWWEIEAPWAPRFPR